MARKAEKIAKDARCAVEQWRTYFKENISQYHDLHEFVLGQQWTDDEQDMLKTYRKIPLTFNKLATLVNSLLGEQQQNTPQLQVVPLSYCDEQTAQLRELIVKDLIFCSHAKTAYQVAGAQACIGGFGAFAIDTDYASPDSFDLDITYRTFKDATRCYWDPAAESVSKTDGMFAGSLSRMSKEKFGQIFGKQTLEKVSTDSKIAASKEEIALATQGQTFDFIDENTITIQDHYVRTPVVTRLFKLSNGKVLTEEELEELVQKSAQEYEDMMLAQGLPMDENAPLLDGGEAVRIESEKERKTYKIKHYKIAGEYILDESEFPSQLLPIVFVDQNSYYDKDGKQVCRPFVIDAVDAQRYINYLGTQSAYVLKVSRYDQWIGSARNVQSADTQNIWQNPASIQGMLTFDESPSGVVPQQVRPPELSQSLHTQYERAINDLYTSTGLYPTRLGQTGNEVSGAAIDARTRQGSYSTFTYFNSINRAIETGGQIVNEMIPAVYDVERVIAIVSPDVGHKTITINEMNEYGEVIRNDMKKGTYQVKLMPGPSYEGQKAQALESLQLAMQSNPQLFTLIADLYAENLPLTNTIELRNRFKTLVPPEIIQAGKTGQPVPPKPQADPAAQMAQMEMQIKAQELQIKQEELKLKENKLKTEYLESMKRMETERLEVAAQLEEQKLRYIAETHRTNSDAAISHADNLTKILTHRM